MFRNGLRAPSPSPERRERAAREQRASGVRVARKRRQSGQNVAKHEAACTSSRRDLPEEQYA